MLPVAWSAQSSMVTWIIVPPVTIDVVDVGSRCFVAHGADGLLLTYYPAYGFPLSGSVELGLSRILCSFDGVLRAASGTTH